MIESSDFRIRKMPLNHGAGHMPVLGFGTLVLDAATTISATTNALEAGFRHIDCAERYRNEREVGEALQAGLAALGIAREDDAWDLFAAYFLNKNLSLTVAYVDLGNIVIEDHQRGVYVSLQAGL